VEDAEAGDHEGNQLLTGVASLCPACFEDKGSSEACPACDGGSRRMRPHLLLAQGVVLDGRFLVGRDLTAPGAVGITYVARDLAVDATVAVREYFPRGLVTRDADGTTVRAVSEADAEVFAAGLALFLQEAQRLAAVNQTSVARVRDCFEQNGTAYLVMDDGGAESLSEYAQRRGLPLSETDALLLLGPILEGLAAAHDQGLLHRDVTPESVRLRPDGRPLLVDFGGARSAVQERSHSLTAAFSSGFTALEQYVRGGRQGPWTDVYGAAATLYWLLTAVVPAPAVDRIKQDEVLPPDGLAPSLSPHVAHAVTRGLALEISKRPRSTREFLALLAGSETQTEAGDAEAGAAADTPSPARWSLTTPVRWRAGVLAAVAAASVCLGIALARHGGGTPAASTPPTPREAAHVPDTPVAAVEPRKAPDVLRSPGEIWTDPGIGIELAWIPRGRFRMGSERYPDERPVHEVEIQRGFWLQTTEVTQGQWVKVMRTQPWKSGWGTEQGALRRDDCPVVHVTWMDAQAFVGRLNAAGEGGYRLPSEAEWEYACRVGEDSSDTVDGEHMPLGEVAWFEENASMLDEPYGHPVRTRRPNRWGLFDMHGNVWEWCQDWFHPSYDGAPTDGAAWETPRGTASVIRGGAFAASSSNCRAANRESADPALRSGSLGFRVARTAGPAS
jgi:formylglycine-generating enzyme required for sulfatase activity